MLCARTCSARGSWRDKGAYPGLSFDAMRVEALGGYCAPGSLRAGGVYAGAWTMGDMH